MNIERKFLKFIREKAGTSKFTDLDFASAMRVPIKQAKDFLMTLDGTYLSISYTDNSATANYQMNSEIKYNEMYKNIFDYLLDNLSKIIVGFLIIICLGGFVWALYMNENYWVPEKEAKQLVIDQQNKIQRDLQQKEKDKKEATEKLEKKLTEQKVKLEAKNKFDQLLLAVVNGRKEIITKTNKCLDPAFSQLMLGYYDNYVIVNKGENGEIKYRYPLTLNIEPATLPTSEPTSQNSN